MVDEAYILRDLMDIEEDYPEQQLARIHAQMTPEQRSELDRQLGWLVSILPAGLPPDRMALLLYEIITRSVTYEHAEDPFDFKYSYVGCLLRKRAVCMGIAQLYERLCTLCGIPCRVVIGYGGAARPDGGGRHAWNMVRLDLDGESRWYHCDPTYDLGRCLEHYLKSDQDMRLSDHLWLTDRYPPCPQSAPTPRNVFKEEGVEYACRLFKLVPVSA